MFEELNIKTPCTSGNHTHGPWIYQDKMVSTISLQKGGQFIEGGGGEGGPPPKKQIWRKQILTKKAV